MASIDLRRRRPQEQLAPPAPYVAPPINDHVHEQRKAVSFYNTQILNRAKQGTYGSNPPPLAGRIESIDDVKEKARQNGVAWPGVLPELQDGDEQGGTTQGTTHPQLAEWLSQVPGGGSQPDVNTFANRAPLTLQSTAPAVTVPFSDARSSSFGLNVDAPSTGTNPTSSSATSRPTPANDSSLPQNYVGKVGPAYDRAPAQAPLPDGTRLVVPNNRPDLKGFGTVDVGTAPSIPDGTSGIAVNGKTYTHDAAGNLVASAPVAYQNPGLKQFVNASPVAPAAPAASPISSPANLANNPVPTQGIGDLRMADEARLTSPGTAAANTVKGALARFGEGADDAKNTAAGFVNNAVSNVGDFVTSFTGAPSSNTTAAASVDNAVATDPAKRQQVTDPTQTSSTPAQMAGGYNLAAYPGAANTSTASAAPNIAPPASDSPANAPAAPFKAPALNSFVNAPVPVPTSLGLGSEDGFTSNQPGPMNSSQAMDHFVSAVQPPGAPNSQQQQPAPITTVPNPGGDIDPATGLPRKKLVASDSSDS